LDEQRIKHKISVAQRINTTRLEKMKKRNECIDNLRTASAYRLQNDYGKDNPKYVETLKNLIVQVSVSSSF